MARVLLIEPDKIIAGNVRSVLRSQGHGVDWQADPQAAMDSADAIRPDIVITDLLLAGRSGVEFLYEFRSYPEWSEVPIIIYSSVSPEEFSASTVGLESLNVAAYHYKPQTTSKQLCQSIDRVLQKSPA